MKYLLITLLLTGCYQSVNLNDINTAAKACGSLENVEHISANFVGEEYATCQDRTQVFLNDKVWTRK